MNQNLWKTNEVNVAEGERWLSAIAGALLAVAGLGKKSVGGLFLALGLFTRVACIIQIPILIGALLFLANNRTALEPYSQWVVTLIALLLTVFFLIEGNGPLSVEQFPSPVPPGTGWPVSSRCRAATSI